MSRNIVRGLSYVLSYIVVLMAQLDFQAEDHRQELLVVNCNHSVHIVIHCAERRSQRLEEEEKHQVLIN